MGSEEEGAAALTRKYSEGAASDLAGSSNRLSPGEALGVGNEPGTAAAPPSRSSSPNTEGKGEGAQALASWLKFIFGPAVAAAKMEPIEDEDWLHLAEAAPLPLDELHRVETQLQEEKARRERAEAVVEVARRWVAVYDAQRSTNVEWSNAMQQLRQVLAKAAPPSLDADYPSGDEGDDAA